MKNQVQLITYVDRLSGGGFAELGALLDGPLAGLFGTVHPLPFFYPIDGSDAGFDPIDHTLVDPRLGRWKDVSQIAEHTDILVDLIVNHVSSGSAAFQDFLSRGDDSDHAGMFLTFDKVFPDGASEADILAIYRPRPNLCFTPMTFRDGTKRLIWTTFTQQQIDIDVFSDEGAAYLEAILDLFAKSGVTAIRLDAAGYAVKTPGTSCFMTPETFEFLGTLADKARGRGMEVLVEVHGYSGDQIEIASKVDMVYDFALPPLLLHALHTGDAAPLADWLKISPRNCLTVLDTHDGIGVIDVGAATDGRPGLLEPAAINALVDTMHDATGGTSRKATGASASNLDLYQVNSTYFDVLGRDANAYLIARAVQFFCPGIPQVYYVGLLGGTNDMELLAQTGVGRDINRHFYTPEEVSAALKTPMVRKLCDLIRFRNTHPAFSGDFDMQTPAPGRLILSWTAGEARAELSVDFKAKKAVIRHAGAAGEETVFSPGIG